MKDAFWIIWSLKFSGGERNEYFKPYRYLCETRYKVTTVHACINRT